MKIPSLLYCTRVVLERGDQIARDPDLLRKGIKSPIYILTVINRRKQIFVSNDNFLESELPKELEVSSGGYLPRDKDMYEGFLWEKYRPVK